MYTSNYHTHTKRCGHADGEDEDYVLEALGHGIRNLGFSDHIMLPNYSEPYVRGDFSLFDDYCESINSLKDKYKDQMNIYLGFEAESFPEYFPFYKELIDNGAIDYLILGNHCIINEDHKIVTHFHNITNVSQLYAYRDFAIKALSTGMFSIFAHPDYFMSSIEIFDSDCRKVSRDLIECCIANDIPLEINLAGIRQGMKQYQHERRYQYPNDDFFALVSRYKAKCVFGMDAHAPEQLNNDVAEFKAAEFAKMHHLIVIDKVDKIRQH